MQLGQEKVTSWVTCGVKQSFSLLRGNVVCRNRNKKILNSIKSCKKVFYSFRQRGIISLVWRHNHLEPIPQTSVSLNLQLQVPPRTPKKPCVIITCKGFFVKRRPIFRCNSCSIVFCIVECILQVHKCSKDRSQECKSCKQIYFENLSRKMTI